MKPCILASYRFNGTSLPVKEIESLLKAGRSPLIGDVTDRLSAVFTHTSMGDYHNRAIVTSIIDKIYQKYEYEGCDIPIPESDELFFISDKNLIKQETFRMTDEDAPYKLFKVASTLKSAEECFLHPSKVKNIYRQMSNNEKAVYTFISFDVSDLKEKHKFKDGECLELVIFVDDTVNWVRFVYKEGTDRYMAFGVVPERPYTLLDTRLVYSSSSIVNAYWRIGDETPPKQPSTCAKTPLATKNYYDSFIRRLVQEIADQKFIKFFKEDYLPETILEWIESCNNKGKHEFFIAGGFLRDALYSFETGTPFTHNGIDIFYSGNTMSPNNIFNTENTSFFKINGEINEVTIKEFIGTFDFFANMIAFDGNRIYFPTGLRGSILHSVRCKTLTASPNHKFFMKQVPPNERLEWLEQQGYNIPHAEYCKYIATLNSISSGIKLG